MAAYTAIDDPEAYFQAVLWTGNGSTQSITLPGDTDMSPNLVWAAGRSNADDRPLFDTVRGTGKALLSDLTNAEATSATTLTSFDSDGFSLGNNGVVNLNTYTYLAWCWKESATAGFDIVGYTGNGSSQDISHSLSAVPEMMIVKSRSDASDWAVYTRPGGDEKWLQLNDYSILQDSTGRWNDTTPTSSVFTVGDGDPVNESGDTFVNYLFTSKQGFSKIGTYIGNEAQNFIYLGFRPAWLMIKRIDTQDTNSNFNGSHWVITDNKINPDNRGVENAFMADTNYAMDTTNLTGIDFLSNGFCFKAGEDSVNKGTLIYMAFAEAPLVNSEGVPCNAR